MLDKLLQNKKVFIFDLDGTLIDSMGIRNKVDKTLIHDLAGIDIEEERTNHIKDTIVGNSTSEDPYVDYVKYIKDIFHIKENIESIVEYRHQVIDRLLKTEVTLKPYAKELIHLLHQLGYTLILATTSDRHCLSIYKEENENTKELDFAQNFDFLFTMESVEKYKPNPEIHELALKFVDCSKEEIVVLEDSYQGIMAAKNAHLSCIAIKDYYSLDKEKLLHQKSDYYADSLEEIFQYYQKKKLKKS